MKAGFKKKDFLNNITKRNESWIYEYTEKQNVSHQNGICKILQDQTNFGK